MPEPRRAPTKLLITGGVVAAVIIAVIIVIATRSDDSDSSSPDTSALVIQSPATVTGITGVTGATASGASATTGVGNTYTLVRTLAAAGTFDCTNLGSWQPFVEIPVAVPVGQPSAGSTCGDSVLDLPDGYCADSCSAVPDGWRVVEDPHVTPQALMLIVAPTGTTGTAQFLCVQNLVPQIKQVLPDATSITAACSAATSNSVEIPYVPPATSDIPYVPPPVSVDIPTSGG